MQPYVNFSFSMISFCTWPSEQQQQQHEHSVAWTMSSLMPYFRATSRRTIERMMRHWQGTTSQQRAPQRARQRICSSSSVRKGSIAEIEIALEYIHIPQQQFCMHPLQLQHSLPEKQSKRPTLQGPPSDGCRLKPCVVLL